jgi:hypothetical protein
MGEADRVKMITIPNHPPRSNEWQNVNWWRREKRTKPNQASRSEKSVGLAGGERKEIMKLNQQLHLVTIETKPNQAARGEKLGKTRRRRMERYN